MCEVLRVSRGGYYSWLNRSESDRSKDNRQLLRDVRMVHGQSRRIYGSPRVTIELNESGISCSVNRVAHLMRSAGLRTKTKRKYRVTTNSKHNFPVAQNLLNRQFAVDHPNLVWLSDITYIRTTEGWLYLAVVLDLCSRQVVGWSMGSRLTRELTLAALKQALNRRRPQPGLIHHSDQGSQYAADDYQKLLRANQITCSMSRKGDPWDNAPMESFFASLKTELVYDENFVTREDAKAKIFEYIEMFYNRVRRHSSLGYQSPENFERTTTIA